MLLHRDLKRLVFLVGPLLILLYVGVRFYFHEPTIPAQLGNWIQTTFSSNISGKPQQPLSPWDSSSSASSATATSGQGNDFLATKTQNEVFSASTKDGNFFHIKFGTERGINPNIIPHPLLENTWIIVAQQYKDPGSDHTFFVELVCNAAFNAEGDSLECVDLPIILPIAATSGDKCEGELSWFSFNVGPHDARVFYGPKTPYTVYGSNSGYTCFGQWIQDFRMLVPWGMDMVKQDQFRLGTEIQRPLPYGPIEKNWFLFWDRDDQAYVHYDVAPRRIFAKLADDGSAGPDIAPLAAANDEICMAKYMPAVAPQLESVHQTTNSLTITMCKRSDPLCKQTADNTFIFTLFQHKTYYDFHSIYYPYVMMFQRQAPFEIFAIGTKSIWIHGREMLPGDRGESQMFYVTSMSWKARGQKYHGYLDDVLLVAFGIEDSDTGGIDVVAGDLVRGLGLCSDL